MISCTAHSDRRRLTITFSVTDPERADQQINVVGDFNGWDRSATPMCRTADTHTAEVALDPGRRYRFRYLSSADGWFNDETAGWYEFNEFGEKNCVLDLGIVHPDGLRRTAVPIQVGR